MRKHFKIPPKIYNFRRNHTVIKTYIGVTNMNEFISANFKLSHIRLLYVTTVNFLGEPPLPVLSQL